MPSQDATVKVQLERYLGLLREDYRDLQAPTCDLLDRPPSAVEAARMIHKAHPTLIKGVSVLDPLSGERDWDAAETYTEILGDGEVTIAVTDDGLADSVRSLPDSNRTFVKPLEQTMPMRTFLNRLRDPNETEVLYLQSQDGNIYRSEPHPNGNPPQLSVFSSLIERDIGWMKEAVGSSAEAVNLWIGSSRSVTSLHHDPYENIYHVLSGSKTFTLLSSIEGLWLDQQFYPPSTLHRTPSGLAPVLDPPPAYPVPWVASTTVTPGINAINVEVKAGESLYLPAEWWHRVEQSPGPGGLCVAVNYWYPATLDPSRYALERFVRRAARLAGRTGVIPVPGDEDEDDESYNVEGNEVIELEPWDPMGQ